MFDACLELFMDREKCPWRSKRSGRDEESENVCRKGKDYWNYKFKKL